MNFELEVDNMYREVILDLYRNPLNKKIVVDYHLEYHEFNPICGDDITVQMKFDKQERIADIGHQGHGCAISQAAVSLLTEEIKGKTKEEIQKITDNDIYHLLGFTVVYTRQKCALLGLVAIQRALKKGGENFTMKKELR